MNQLAANNPFLMQAITWHPQVRDIISQGRKCAICGNFFLAIWLECVEFVPPSKVNCVFCVNVSIRSLIVCPYLSQPIQARFKSKN